MRTSPQIDLDPIFLERWSPRAFDRSAISQPELLTIIEAARWAPSAFNYQPWRFLYALRDDQHWFRFLSLLIPFNQAWAKEAAALIFIVSDTVSVGPEGPTPLYSHSFDAGAAWAQLSLQALKLGYFTHAMTGIDFESARIQLAVPVQFRIEAAVAVGKMGDAALLADDLRSMESPSDRKPIEEIAFSGNFLK